MRFAIHIRSLAPIVPLLLLAGPAQATFHFMEIEKIIGGVGGDPTAQAIQLKMRTLSQQFLASQARLVVSDATGSNPITLINFASNVVGGTCREILIASASFPSKTTPAAVPDYTLTSLIPASYLAAGSLEFQGVVGPVTYWRVSWGGGSYTGPGTVSVANDADGNANPPFGSALPSGGAQALEKQTACPSASTNNAADYAINSGPVTVTNNAGTSFTVNVLPPGTVPALSPLGLVGLAATLALVSMPLLSRLVRRALAPS